VRILITNNTLDTRAGTELYVRDVVTALLKRGHTPIAYSEVLGEVAREIRDATIPVVDNLDALAVPPDVIHGHHHLETMAALLRFPAVPAVYFCHGSIPWEEKPPRFPRILRYVAVDYACRDRLIMESGVPQDRVTMLPNFVDLERFKPRGPLPSRPKRGLVFSNHASERSSIPAVRQACAHHGIKLDVVGVNAGRACDRPEDILGRYDIVFAKGRAALEALAVGTAVVLCDKRGLGPLVTSTELDYLRSHNLGLRVMGDPVEVDALDQQIARYDHQDAAKVSRMIRASAGRDAVVDQIISIYEEVIAENHKIVKPEGDYEARAATAYLRSLSLDFKALNAKALLTEELTSRVVEKEQELQKIRATLGWRLLNRYGLFKHRFLLPASKSFRKIFKPWNYQHNGSPAQDQSIRSLVSEGESAEDTEQAPTMKEIFSDIYRRRSWGEDCESVSGPGSSLERTSAFRDEIALLVGEINARIVLDAGCGDFNWMRHLDLHLDQYIGIDVVPELVSENQRRYGNGTTTFHSIDLTKDKLSRADVILSRDCLVHLSFQDVFEALRNFKESGSTYLLTTTFTTHETNTDIQTGDWRPLNLQLPPFNFPAPIKLIDEKRELTRGISAHKYLALWALRDIRLEPSAVGKVPNLPSELISTRMHT
jgi:hypothetical protein